MNTKTEAKQSTIQIPSELVENAKAGDSAAFSELYTLTSASLYRSIRAMTRDEDLTWDIQQDTYLRAYRSLNTLENNEAFFPWLRRIAVNLTATRMSKRLPMTFTDLADEDGELPELPDLRVEAQPELSLDRQETSRLVQEILATLPEEQHLILGMRYYDELSVKEIAELLHLAPGTVKAQLFHGRKKVETAVRTLEKQGVKLYGLSPLAFLLSLMRSLEPVTAKQAAVQTAISKAAGAAVQTAVPTMSAQTLGQTLLHGLVAKVLVGVLSVAVVGGCVWAGSKLFSQGPQDAPYQPSETTVLHETDTELDTDAMLHTQTTEDLTESEPSTAPETTAEPEPSTAPETTAEPEPSTEPETTEPEPSTEPESTNESSALSGSCGEDLTWRFDPGTGTLTISGSGKNLTCGLDAIPWAACQADIKTVSLPEGLTSIGPFAFFRCTALKQIAFPTSLETIGEWAFSECPLEELRFPEGLVRIDQFAFAHCTKLKEVFLPATLIAIGQGAFSSCASLNAFHVAAGNAVYSSDASGVLFNKEQTSLIQYPYNRAGAYVIPDGVDLILPYAFRHCQKLTELTIPASLAVIDVEAFTGSTDLEKVTFSEGLISVESRAFEGCPKLTEVALPKSLEEIGAYAFGYLYNGSEIVGKPLESFTVSGYTGSAAQTYAEAYGFRFVALSDAP